MKKEDIKIIKEALELSRASWKSLCREDMVDVIDNALAMLATIEGEGAEPVASPYAIKRVDSHMAVLWDIIGPTENDEWQPTEGAAERFAKKMNAAYNAGLKAGQATPQPAKEGADPVVHVHTVYDAVGGGYICSGCEQRFTTTPQPPAPVVDIERIMEVVEQWHEDAGEDPISGLHAFDMIKISPFRAEAIADLRTRLTNALTPKL